MDRTVINKYKNENDRLLIAKIIDKIKFCETKNKIQSTDFLDTVQQKLIENFLKSQKVTNYFYTGGYEKAERKILIIYPEKLENIISNINLNEYIKVIRITLPNELQGEYVHKNYLGGLMKLGIAREKIGDILVENNGADILVSPDILKFLSDNITSLTRFSKSQIEQIDLENLKKIETKTEIIKISVSSMRLDNMVSELAKCSRGKANEILEQERVLVNYETAYKPSKEIKIDDTITIRGKGRFVIKGIVGNSKKGRIYLEIEKFV
jgi:RNA-binding protein YlmH